MLAGRLCSIRCHSSIVLRAQSRCASIISLQSAPQLTTRQVHIGIRDTFPLLGTVNPSKRRVPLRHASSGVSWMSTSTTLHGSTNLAERKFLIPRNKPRLRERSQAETELFRALGETRSGIVSKKEDCLDKKGIETKAKDMAMEDIESAAAFEPFITPNQTTTEVLPELVPGGKPQASHGLTKSRRGSPKLSLASRSEASTSDLQAELLYLAHNDPNPTAIHHILKILICDREIKPTTEHYEALILANIWPEYGSVDNVEKILAEMEAESVEISTNVIMAVFKVLAVHPSPELSSAMLDMVERKWIQLTPQTHHHLVLGIVRAGQTELAAWMMENMRLSQQAMRSGGQEVIPDYVGVILITELFEQGDWESILRHVYALRDRRAADRDIPIKFWAWLLEQAAKDARAVAKAIRVASNDVNTPSSNTIEPSPGPPVIPKPPHTSSSTTSSRATPSTLTTHVQTQISLLNPAQHIVNFIWTYYVSSMSIRPTFSTCLDVMHMSADTGAVWLAESVHAVLLYMDGVDAHGRPNATVSPRVSGLVAIAKKRALQVQAEKDRLEGRDTEAEKRMEEEREKKRKEIQRKDEEWWDQLIAGAARTAEDANANAKTPVDKDIVDPKTPSSTPTSAEPNHTSDNLDPNTFSNHFFPSGKSDEQPSQPSEKFQPIDRSTAPPGNLWPFFPSIGDYGSAHIDPWDALGPRSSSTGKWSEAQQYYKRRDRMVRAIENKKKS